MTWLDFSTPMGSTADPSASSCTSRTPSRTLNACCWGCDQDNALFSQTAIEPLDRLADIIGQPRVTGLELEGGPVSPARHADQTNGHAGGLEFLLQDFRLL